MDIATLFVSQKKLRRVSQIPGLVQALLSGEEIPPVQLREDEDGSVQVDDGHHRLVAYWLSGRENLARHEYRLFLAAPFRPRFGGIADLATRMGLEKPGEC